MNRTSVIARFALCGTLALCALSSAAHAADRESPYEKIKDAVIRKAHPIAGQSVLTVNAGFGFGQEYTRDLQFSLSYRYHFNEYLGAGLTAAFSLPFESGLVDEIRSVRPASLNNLQPEAMMLGVTADFHLVPIYGKFVLFGKHAVHYTISVTAGAGMVLAKRKELDGQTGLPAADMKLKAAPAVGASLRLLFSKNVGLSVEFKDYLWDEALATNPAKSGWSNHFSIFVGPAFQF